MSTFTHALATNNYGAAKFIVDASSANGTHTTIASATAAASSGDIIAIRPGTYTENLTLKSGISYISLEDSQSGTITKVIIVGKMIDNGVAVVVTFKGIQFNTNSDFIAVLSGASNVVFNLCFLNCANNTGLSITNGSSNIYLNYCDTNLATTGIHLWSLTGGVLWITYCELANSGNSVATGTLSSGSVVMKYTNSDILMATSSTGVLQLTYCQFASFSSPENTTWVTTAGTNVNWIQNCILYSGTASAISVGSGTTVECYRTTIQSSNTNAVTGAGTFKSDAPSYVGTSRLNNATTKTFTEVGDSGTFTPALNFGGAAVGLTYANRFANYLRIGNLVWFSIDIELSAKGSSTGIANITGLPFASANTAGGASSVFIFAVSASALVFVGQVNARIAAAASSTINLDSWATTGARALLTDTAFGNTTFVQITGCYTA